MTNVRRTLGLAMALLLAAALPGLAQEEKKKPLSEADLVKLAKSDLEDEVIVAVVKKRGVSFKVDDAALKRLKTAGVSETVLAALRPAGDGDKPLATAKQDDGLIVEVLEVRPTKNETLLIRWRYRNPTGKPVQLIAATPRFVSKNSPPNTAKKFWDSIYYTEGKFKTDKAYNCYILIESDSKKKIATDLGKDPVVLRPDHELELWAQFDLPPHKDTKTITLSMMRTPLMKDIPIQRADQ
jgi:hypothetical protein